MPSRSRPSQLGARVALLVAAVLWLSSCRGQQERAAAFVEQWRLAHNSHDLAAFTAMYTEQGAYSCPGMVFWASSREQLRTQLDYIWRQIPDMRITGTDRLTAGGNRIAFAAMLAYTEPMTGKAHTSLGAVFMELQDGKISSQSLYFPP